MQAVAHIGDMVQEGQIVAYTGEKPVYAKMTGIVRGMLQDGVTVEENLKIGDIDARCERAHCFTVSDKARSIGGAALEAVTQFERICGNYAVIVLAAGAGKRFGSNKLLARIQGKPLYEHMLQKLEAMRAFPVYMITGYEQIQIAAKEKGIQAVEQTAGVGDFTFIETWVDGMSEGESGDPGRVVFCMRSAEPDTCYDVFPDTDGNASSGKNHLLRT